MTESLNSDNPEPRNCRLFFLVLASRRGPDSSESVNYSVFLAWTHVIFETHQMIESHIKWPLFWYNFRYPHAPKSGKIMTFLAVCAKKAPTKVRKRTYSLYCFYLGSDFKGNVSRVSCSFWFIANHSLLCTMELNVKKEITFKRQNHSFMSNR